MIQFASGQRMSESLITTSFARGKYFAQNDSEFHNQPELRVVFHHVGCCLFCLPVAIEASFFIEAIQARKSRI